MTLRIRPFDHTGRFIPLACPNPDCGAGTLRYEGNGEWRCDGLADPGRTDKPLEACPTVHFDGDARNTWWKPLAFGETSRKED